MIELGDLVRLKSGGPIMTAGKLIHTVPYQMSCTWFENAQIKIHNFVVSCLSKLELENVPVPQENSW